MADNLADGTCAMVGRYHIEQVDIISFLAATANRMRWKVLATHRRSRK